MNEHEALLRKSYAAYNARDLPTLLTALAPDVEWEDQFEGAVIHGVEAVGAYWRRQWISWTPSWSSSILKWTQWDEGCPP